MIRLPSEQYALAHGFYIRPVDHALYWLAERQSDRTRTFKLRIGEPQQTSYGADLCSEILELETSLPARPDKV